MILYFSGTGNSRWAARQLAEHLGDGDIVSVNDALRQGSVPALRSERPFVVVAPTYAWRLPRVVDAWLRDARLEGSRDVYFVRPAAEAWATLPSTRGRSAATRACATAAWPRW